MDSERASNDILTRTLLARAVGTFAEQLAAGTVGLTPTGRQRPGRLWPRDTLRLRAIQVAETAHSRS
jgi:hypothetical protein